jgi:dipeptidyl aminopeptidase/acylaminoacyl peptidase
VRLEHTPPWPDGTSKAWLGLTAAKISLRTSGLRRLLTGFQLDTIEPTSPEVSTMRKAPYGTWVSPITTELITKSAVRLGNLLVDQGSLYWTELRPLESGRTVLVCKPLAGEAFDVTPAPFNVRTLAHEYGGGAYTVHKGVVYFCNYSDQRIYRQELNGQPEPLTPAAKVHYADIVVDEKRNRLICVQEDLSAEGQEALTTICSISLKDGSTEMLVAGNDFYASPRLSPNGMFLSWISWNHPNMPWDESVVWCANVGSDGSLSNMRKIAGGPGESVFQPQWSPGGELYYVSDRSGWWNIYRHSDYEDTQQLAKRDAEFGLPQWVFGQSTYWFESDNRIICAFGEKGTWKLGSIDTADGVLTEFDLPYSDYAYIQASSGKAFFCGGSPTEPPSIIEMDIETQKCTTLKRASDVQLDRGYLSVPETIEFPTTGGKRAYAFYYAPKNKDFEATNELPPLLVKSHGGPTSAAVTSQNLAIQFWTSRGIGVVDVNYGGSSGFGREYRTRLYDNWGVVDVDDCINAAKYLSEQQRSDANRLAISGGSAGGYTTLCALVFHDVFKAGASYYGISDLEALAHDTHKFESRYLDRLVGPYPAAKELYKQRSPINFVDKLNCPAIFLQGLEDKVVPPSQSEKMVEAVRKKGLPVAYITFEGEQHGFRKAENIRRALECELYFYSRIFNFDPADPIEPVNIENLKSAVR